MTGDSAAGADVGGSGVGDKLPGAGAGEGAGRSAIEHHYDVGRDFYRLWLDEWMIYSCALWDAAEGTTLEQAQQAKLAWHADGAGAGPGARILDIGCGWGGMLRHLLEVRGVGRAVGLTLSSDQAAVASAVPGAEVRLEDWRAHEPDAAYDGIVSIGAFEHFARAGLSTAERRQVYGRFFDRCASWLPAGGRLSLQTIAWEDSGPADTPTAAFFGEDIFPESGLPRLSDVVAGFEPWYRLVAFRSDGAHYERTLAHWQGRLEASRERAMELVGRDTYRRYLRYLRVSRAMFDRRVSTLYRFVLERRPAPLQAPGRAPS